MQKPTIKSNNGTTPANSFFVLCKGKNSGKPLQEATPNCFIVTCQSPDEVQYWYWLTWGLWKSNRFHEFLCGSVIDFIRIEDFKTVLFGAFREVVDNRDQLNRALESMRLLEKRSQSIKMQLGLMAHLQMSIFMKLLKAE